MYGDPCRRPKYAGSIQAILKRPADLVTRRILADELEQDAGYEACPLCRGSGRNPVDDVASTDPLTGATVLWKYAGPDHPCPQCDGSGTVPDGLASRAELIRVGCDLEEHPFTSFIRTGDYDARDGVDEVWSAGFALLLREKSLLDREAYRYGWFFDTGLPVVPSGSHIWSTRYEAAGRIVRAIVSRGFVSGVVVPWSGWFDRRCDRCDGVGGVYNEADGSEDPCLVCHGARILPGLSSRLRTAHPIEYVRFTNKAPRHVSDSLGRGWTWSWPTPDFLENELPAVIKGGIMARHPEWVVHHYLRIPTEEQALKALSEEVLSRPADYRPE